jgi:hypothetical protein
VFTRPLDVDRHVPSAAPGASGDQLPPNHSAPVWRVKPSWVGQIDGAVRPGRSPHPGIRL